jgi:hypothetical protein
MSSRCPSSERSSWRPSRRAQDPAGVGHGHLARLAPGQAEVHQVRLALGVQHDVGRLEVAVDDAGPVGVLQGVGDGGAQLGGLARRQPAVGGEVGQRRPLDEVADDVDLPALAADLVDGDDVGVPQLRRRPRLAEE